MKLRTLASFMLAAMVASSQKLSHGVVLLDGYHNKETKNPLHYRWEGTDDGGFSKLGELLKGLGAELRTTNKSLGASSLRGVGCLIIVDPDTPKEADTPNYISEEEVKAIAAWVEQGGRLVLLGNDKGNAEFEHFNTLAGQFGVRFVEDTIPKTTGKAILEIEGKGPIFDGAPRFYGVELAPLLLAADLRANVLLSYQRTPVMVLVHRAQGLVFALGDPWIYNEYIDRDDNREIARKLFRMLLR